ncbi:LacI family DNA-binding transcriptional regulator [Paenibacillus paeoniae]|uniref:LacI family transcriptional regulator n=1 Tax=Paenibacillus paeoniae TaxID=2292705 RepID=A0A371PGP7_9BACL|nr:LacI family DNA-binding transcriptional regulator [Paenibacillus paeoniae]REK74796.1 LacI family transcriptional regulator [Paenibacillus paeoniae]
MYQDSKTTIKSIASEAGVSIGTVSNVMNGTGRVAEETILKVKRIAKERNYIPNSSARNLRAKKSHLIALIVPFLEKSTIHDSPFYWELATSIESGVRDHNLHVIFTGLDHDQDVSFVRDRNLDGVIVIGTSDDSPIVSQLKSYGVPLVVLDSYLSDPTVHQVHLDDQMGGYVGTKHLIDLGHRRIAFVTDLLLDRGLNYMRWLGYKTALEEHGISYDSNLIIESNLSFNSGYHAAQQVFQKGQDVTAVFVLSDVTAIGLIKGLNELGYSVPERMSVLGFDDIRVTEFSAPPLTTINQNIVDKGQQATRLLMNQIEGIESVQKNIVLPVTLKVRQSTARING